MKKKILMIVGSLREQSFNRQLAEKIREKIGERAEVEWLDYADIPFMNQDIEFPVPEQIKRVRDQVMLSDGLWFVTPEYNFSYPGVLKNLLDWLSRPLQPGDFAGGTAISGKRAVISGAAGKSAAAGARHKLEELLNFLKVDLLAEEQLGISLEKEDFLTNRLVLSKTEERDMEMQVEKFLRFLEAG